MADNETDHQNNPVRPSWETAALSARSAAPRPAAPRPAAPRPVAPPVDSSPPTVSMPPASPEPSSYAPTYSAPTYSALSDAAPLSDPDLQYDLAGNPIIRSTPTPTPAPYAPPAPFGYSAGPAPAAPGVWPPPPSTPYGGAWQNGENGTDQVARLKWNWGAFLIPFWWCVFNGQRGIASVIFLTNLGDRYVPAPFGYVFTVAQFGIMIYLGVMGHRLAWSSERFAGDYDTFIRTQRAWMIWGLALLGLGLIGLVLAFALIPGMLQMFLSNSHPHTGASNVLNP